MPLVFTLAVLPFLCVLRMSSTNSQMVVTDGSAVGVFRVSALLSCSRSFCSINKVLLHQCPVELATEVKVQAPLEEG